MSDPFEFLSNLSPNVSKLGGNLVNAVLDLKEDIVRILDLSSRHDEELRKIREELTRVVAAMAFFERKVNEMEQEIKGLKISRGMAKAKAEQLKADAAEASKALESLRSLEGTLKSMLH